MASFNPKPDTPALWHIRGYGREHHPAGRTYWWDNTRTTSDGSVVQFTLAGEILYRDQAGSQTVGPGTLLLFSYGDQTAYGQPTPLQNPYTCHWTSLFGAGVTAHLRAIIARHGPIHHVGLNHPLAHQHNQLIDLAEPGRAIEPTDLAAAIHHFVMNLHDWAEMRFKEKLAPVEMAIQSILRLPHTPQSLKEIAAQFGVSREHLSRTFRENVGRAAHDVLAQAKCNRALELLKQTRLPVAEVARQAGYANPHSLARHVRKATGHSPTAYRDRA